ncbi:MAG TPA: YggT family protein [Acidimicrobiales bacterium]|nr:YggT family protein [Acidimicrobiales bacterium]
MGLVCSLIQIYVLVIIAGALLSWFPTEPGGGLHQVRMAIARVTDPVMLPVRRAIGASFGGIDFSPIVVIIGLQLLAGIIC